MDLEHIIAQLLEMRSLLDQAIDQVQRLPTQGPSSVDPQSYSSFSGMCRAYGKLPATVYARLRRGIPLEEALTARHAKRGPKPKVKLSVPARPAKYIIDGQPYRSFAALCRALGKPEGTIRVRLRRGMSLEEALKEPQARRGRPPASGKPPDPRIAEMKAMRAARKSKTEIGATYGISRERVRQLIGNDGYLGKPKQWPRAHLGRVMKQWLWDAGIRKCTMCKTWVAEGLTRTHRVCHACNRERSRRNHANEAHRQTSREWKAANRDKVWRYTKRWRDNHPDSVREASRRYIAKKKARNSPTGSPDEPPTT